MKYNLKPLNKALSKKTKILLKLESCSIDYVGELDFDKLIKDFESACIKVGEESFKLRFRKLKGVSQDE